MNTVEYDTFEMLHEYPDKTLNVFNKFYIRFRFTTYKYCNKTFKSPIKCSTKFFPDIMYIGITLSNKYYSFGIGYGKYDPTCSCSG